jgi:transmembrane 9 superfamily protein 2/4
MYKFFNGTHWILLSICSSALLPAFLASTLFVIDICEYIETKRATMVPISDLFILVLLWLSLNVPMTMLGAFFGFKRASIETPVKPNRVARQQSKEKSCFLNRFFCFLFCSSIPFSVILFQFY